VKAWQRFWFAPQSTNALAIFRIVFGLVIVVWAVTLAPDVGTWFGPNGLFPYQPSGRWYVTILGTHPSEGYVVGMYLLLIVSAVCLTVGFGTRIAAVLVWLLVMSFDRRNPLILNAGDDLVRIDAFLLMLTPSGAALSVDRWLRHRDDFWAAPRRALWGVRLIQLQLSAVYLFAVWAKVRGVDWNNGTAVSYALQMHDIQRFAAPTPFFHNIWLVNLQTFGTLVVELSLALFIWNRRARPWVISAGILLHLSIELGILVGFFSIIMITTYLAFLTPEAADRLVANVRRVVHRDREPIPDVTPAKPVTPSPLVGQVPSQS